MGTANKLVQGGVTRSHDLTGIVFQKLIADRKFLATYYTRPEAAALLAGLALPLDQPLGGSDWGDGETLAAVQIGDFACGTGTLLAAAYQRLSLLHELHGGDPKTLHGPLMKNGLVGADVLNIAVHLTAAMLAGSHPDTPFDGECLLTMPYGEQENGDVAVGSLDLLAPHIQPSLVGQAAATTAGGRAPEDIQDLINRVGHGKFDLVIMNPPFTRPTGQEGKKKGSGNPAFAAFGTPKHIQEKMNQRTRKARSGPSLAKGNTGYAADFLDIAIRKNTSQGALALVLPLSAVSGVDWDRARDYLGNKYHQVLVVTIAGAGSEESSFSANTGMAEALIVARRLSSAELGTSRGFFATLSKAPQSTAEASLIADVILKNLRHPVRKLEDGAIGATPLRIGSQQVGHLLDCPLPAERPWPVVGIADGALAQIAHSIEHGLLELPSLPPRETPRLGMVATSDLAEMGPYHMDIYWTNADGSPRGPFDLVKPAANTVPTYPMLWAHEAKEERRLTVPFDSEGQIKSVGTDFDQDAVRESAAEVWSTATRAHYNRDLQFNSQSLVVAMTERRCIGGRAWPSVIFANPEHEYAFSLWSNSTLGLLLHWWSTNKTQSGRGTTTLTAIPNIPTLDVRALTAEQHARARQAFQRLSKEQFLPFDQIDEDPAREKLDRALLVDVLGLPESLCEPGGPLELLRRKLAAEPQIHGGKKSRVVFTENGERAVRRSDR